MRRPRIGRWSAETYSKGYEDGLRDGGLELTVRRLVDDRSVTWEEVRVADMSILKAVVEAAAPSPKEWRPLSAVVGPPLFGIPVIVDPTLAAGCVEVRLSDGTLRLFRLESEA